MLQKKKKTEQRSAKLLHCPACNMTRLSSKCPLKLYATVQMDQIPHVVNLFIEHLQYLLDAYTDFAPSKITASKAVIKEQTRLINMVCMYQFYKTVMASTKDYRAL